MKLRTAEAKNNIKNIDNLQQELSFEYLIQFLERRIAEQGTDERTFPKLMLERIHTLQHEFGQISFDNVHNFQEIFDYIYFLSSNALNQGDIFWALGQPIPHKVIYGEDSFYSLIDNDLKLIDESVNSPISMSSDFSNKILYLLILERFYNLPLINFVQLFEIKDEDVKKYYQLKIDFTFLEVHLLKDLPVLDTSYLQKREISCFEDVIPLLESIDLSSFVFKGFTILKFVNKSTDYVVTQLRELISGLPNVTALNDVITFDKQLFWNNLKEIIHTIAQSKEVHSSFFPLLELNGLPILTSDLSKKSIFFGELIEREKDNCQSNIFSYLKDPFTITYGVEGSLNSTDPILTGYLERLGLNTYICFPLKSKNNLVGFLELYSFKKDFLDKQKILDIVSILPLMTDLAADLVATFRSLMDKVILDNYTTLQEAVQWKFNQVAANYLSSTFIDKTPSTIENISFPKVYPIYGAIDIRNSTRIRNMAYKKDSYDRLALLQLIVDQLEDTGATAEETKFILRFNLVKGWLDEGKLDSYLLDVLSFFQDEVPDFLKVMNINDPFLEKYKLEYFAKYYSSNLESDSRSELFEKSLLMLNRIIDGELEQFNAYVQKQYPSYFEKFRTDGFEYDMYIGQSITPKKVFDPKILRGIRKQQILSMVNIAKKAFKTIDELPVSLVTTQLIFVHPNPIDISFRLDERRFDVDGGYNIRYEVIKKRIDKARIKDTNERLVQPNKIAIVYSSTRIENELKSILDEIASENWVAADIEQVVLEELQGIEALNAFRVTVPV